MFTRFSWLSLAVGESSRNPFIDNFVQQRFETPFGLLAAHGFIIPCTTHAMHRPKGIKRPTSMAFYRRWKGLAAKGVFHISHPHWDEKLGPEKGGSDIS